MFFHFISSYNRSDVNYPYYHQCLDYHVVRIFRSHCGQIRTVRWSGLVPGTYLVARSHF
jgi:hypothetical protein